MPLACPLPLPAQPALPSRQRFYSRTGDRFGCVCFGSAVNAARRHVVRGKGPLLQLLHGGLG